MDAVTNIIKSRDRTGHQKSLIFNVFTKSSTEHKSLLPFYNNQIFFVATKPFHTLRHLAFDHFIKLDKSPLKIITPTTVDVSFTSMEITYSKNVFDHIDNALLCHPIIKTELKSCAKILENERLLTFYTDGSVQNIGGTHSLSGYGWTQVQPFTPKVTFKGSTVFFPIINKNQLYPTIQHKTSLTSDQPTTKLKQTNFLLWDLIFFLINEKHLLITLHKVTGHSSNAHNDEADRLAKSGAHLKEPIIINHKFFFKQTLGIVAWNNSHVIDRNVRKWLYYHQATNFKWRHRLVKEWLQHNPTDALCGAKLSKIQGNKIKKCNFIYPTIDIQQRNYPRLYPIGNIPCKDCNDIQNSNAHIGICHNHSNDIITLLLDEGYNLLQLIRDNTKETPYALEATIRSSRFFDTNFNGPLLTSHPCYLLIHNLVPTPE
ncbi:ribonuclease H-like domain-containing protein [Rhizophagus irregularis DAOM 181602=DAOM 197198]|nr:ribonuclease H-like domain-containing protein [Rhizophagus irregularis DAOM 181602=DAOM 197198]